MILHRSQGIAVTVAGFNFSSRLALESSGPRLHLHVLPGHPNIGRLSNSCSSDAWIYM